MDEYLNRAVRLLGSEFGAPAHTRVFAPGRVNLIGEHIDYNGGRVMPCSR